MLMLQPFQVFNFFLLQENGTLIFSSLFLLCKKLKAHIFSLDKKVEYSISSFFSGEQMEGPCIFLLTKKWNTQFPSFFGGNKWRAHVTPCIFSQQKSGMLISKLFFSWATNGTHVFLSLTFESLLCPSPSLKKGFKRQMPIFKFFCCRTKMEGAYFLFSQKGGNLFLSSFFLVFSEKGNATHRLFS